MDKNIIAKISAIFLALIVGFGAPATALAADTGGGIGGGSSTGNLTGPIYWKSIAYNDSNATNQKTWKKFLSETANPNSEVESQVRGRVGNLEVCKKSKVIWYINHRATNNWVFNYSYTRTHGSDWNNYWNNYGDSTIENPHIKVGRVPTTSEIDAFRKWDSTKNGNKIDQKPGYTVICSGAFIAPPDEYFYKFETKETSSTNNSKVYRHPYSYITDVKPQFIKASKDDEKAATKDLIGEPNLEPQSGTPVKTNFGKLWDRIDKGLKLSPADLDTQVKAAVKKDEAISHSTVTLNDKNKAGMAEGGVLNVYEQTKYAEVSSSSLTKYDKVERCQYVKKWNDSKQQFDAPKKVSCSPYSNTATGTTITMKSEMGTMENTGFYQMISVHCNPEDFKALINSGNGITVTNGSAELVDGTISGSAITKKYPKQPTHLDFGDTSNPNAARAATGVLGFYDKECAFECTPDSKTSNAQANGAKNNVELTGNVVDGTRKGAKTSYSTGAVNSNSLEFFRDNDKKQVKVDLWYPVRNGVVLYDGEDPVTTTVSRWEKGTPHPQSTSGGKFTMTSTNGNKPLFTGKDKVKTQKNWNHEEFNNANSTILPGKHDSFYLSSTWASEQDRPQVFNIKYEYKPMVNSRIYTNNIGFGANGKQNLGTASTVATAIDGKCYVNYRNSSSEPQMNTKELFYKNTGTGTTNGLDGQIVQGAGSVNESKDKQTNLVVNFVRSTTE